MFWELNRTLSSGRGAELWKGHRCSLSCSTLSVGWCGAVGVWAAWFLSVLHWVYMPCLIHCVWNNKINLWDCSLKLEISLKVLYESTISFWSSVMSLNILCLLCLRFSYQYIYMLVKLLSNVSCIFLPFAFDHVTFTLDLFIFYPRVTMKPKVFWI